MQRVTRSTAVPVMPAPPASPGTPGFFTGGDPVSDTPATVPGFEWHNGMQEVVVLSFEDSGIAPDANVHTQMRDHVRRMAGGNVTALTAAAVLTPDHAGVVSIAIAANQTFTLPAANAANGRPIRINLVRTDTTAFTATIQRAGTDTIEGLTSITLPVGGRLTLVSDGVSAWLLVARSTAMTSMQVFTAGGTFTVPPGVFRVRVTCTGGGGAGSGSTTSGGGGGGSAGQTAIGYYDVTPGDAIPVTVGAAGVGGAGNGGNGGTSSFGAYCSASGGIGGTSATGAGGRSNVVAVGGQILLTGGDGTDGTSGTGQGIMGGAGGASCWGGGGRGGAFSGGGGQAGRTPGSGGGGAYAAGVTGAANGGNGAGGIVVVEY